jgi:hypothetical protein
MEVTMRTKTKAIIKVSLIIAIVVLIAGCTPGKGILPGKKCDIDSDCGGAYCSENQRKAVSSTCLKGRCEATTIECAESEICVQDSLGVKCAMKDPDTNKPIMSCSINSTTLNTLGINSFNPGIYMCGDDCPADSYCTDTCYCEKKVKISCSENTNDTDDLGANLFNDITFMCAADCPGGYYCSDACYCEEKEEISCNENTDDTDTFGENIFSETTERCADDCPRGSLCTGQCICNEYECPDPVFTTNYWGDAPLVDFDFEFLYSLWLANPRSLLELGDEVDITAYEHYRDGGFYYIPFPEVQLTLVPNPDNEYITKEGWEAYCVNDYYDGEKALDIYFELLTRQDKETCYWGGTVGFEGVLTVCPELLLDWFDAYTP